MKDTRYSSLASAQKFQLAWKMIQVVFICTNTKTANFSVTFRHKRARAAVSNFTIYNDWKILRKYATQKQ